MYIGGRSPGEQLHGWHAACDSQCVGHPLRPAAGFPRVFQTESVAATLAAGVRPFVRPVALCMINVHTMHGEERLALAAPEPGRNICNEGSACAYEPRMIKISTSRPNVTKPGRFKLRTR
jgi:hypothetical protein